MYDGSSYKIFETRNVIDRKDVFYAAVGLEI